MLNQINQFARIQLRNAGAIATGCPIDADYNMLGVSVWYRDLLERDQTPLRLGDRLIRFGGRFTEGLRRLHQLRHWHSPLNCLQRHLQLQQG